MPVEAKRLGALETKSVTRKTLEVYAASVREFCDWSGLSADSDVEALEVDRLLTEFTDLLFFFTGPPGLDRREIVGKRPLLLSNFLAAGGESTGSELPSPQMMETGVSEFFETTPPRSNLDRPDRGDVQDQWYAGGCADPGHVRSLSPTSGTQTYEFLGTDGGWSPKLCDTFVPSGWYREKQNWRGGRHDQSRLKTMSMGGSGVREASAMTATRKSFAQPELRRIRVVVPPSRRESAGGYGAISRTPLQSFGGESRKPANFGIRTRNAGDGNQPSLCAATRKADVSIKVGQSSLHWSRHIASTATTACPRYCFMVTPLRHRLDCSVFCDRSLQCKHRFATVFPERRCTVCKTRTFF